MKFLVLLLVSLISVLQPTVLAQKLFKEGSPLAITVKPLTPGGNSYDDKLYLHNVNYYHPTLDSCGPANQSEKGSFAEGNDTYIYTADPFFGNHFYNAPIRTRFLIKTGCDKMCYKEHKKANVRLINELIKRNYKLNFYIDDVPVGRELYDLQTHKFYVDSGVPLGYIDMDKIPHVYNHFQFIVYYVSYGMEYEILYATVGLNSLSRSIVVPTSCSLHPPLLLHYSDYADNGNKITYDVVYKEVQINKWDKWSLYDNDVVKPWVAHSIITIFTLLTIIITLYTIQTINTAFRSEKQAIFVKKSTARQLDKSGGTINEETIDEVLEFSWPSLVNDVFRVPSFSPLLFGLLSNGLHFTAVMILVILATTLGFVDVHSVRFQLEYTVFYLFLLTSPISGLFNSYLFKLFDSTQPNSIGYFRKKLFQTLFIQVFALPLSLLVLVMWANKIYSTTFSTIHISVNEFLRTSVIYSTITTISFLIGLKVFHPPVYRVSDISKSISTPPITFQLIPNMIVSGLFPFGVILIPLSSFYITIWYGHFYSTSTLLFTLLLSLILIVSINVLNVYHSLSIGNWKWAWFSFLNGFSIGVYTFAYSFYLTKLKFGDRESLFIFLIQDITISSVIGLIGGSVSFWACYQLVKSLYNGL